MREVLTYARRGSRFTPRQREAWDAHHERWVVPDEAVDPAGLPVVRLVRPRRRRWSSRSARGSARRRRPRGRQCRRTTCWPSRSGGPASPMGLWRVAETGGDQRAVLLGGRRCGRWSAWSGPGELAGLWTFFPDPWHKKKHHKRRLVTPPFAALAASRLAPGAVWRLATDWADYAEQMVEVLDAEPQLAGWRRTSVGGASVTEFERKGLAAGRRITDLSYVRR